MPKRQDLQLIAGLRAEVRAKGQNEGNQQVKHGRRSLRRSTAKFNDFNRDGIFRNYSRYLQTVLYQTLE